MGAARLDPPRSTVSASAGCRPIPGSPPSPLDLPRGLPLRAALPLPLRALRRPCRSRSNASAPGTRDACHLDPAAAARASSQRPRRRVRDGGALSDAAQRPRCSRRRDLVKHFPVRTGMFDRGRRVRARRRRGLASPFDRARRSAWSASRAAASRRSAAARPPPTSRRAGTSASTGADITTLSRRAAAAASPRRCR